MATINTPMHTDQERPLRELVQQLSRDGSLLVQQEIALAKKEFEEKFEHLKKQSVKIGIGAALVYAGVLTLIACLVLLFDLAVPAWFAALIVGAAVTVVGAVLAKRGQSEMKGTTLTPERSARSVRTDFRMMKEATR